MMRHLVLSLVLVFSLSLACAAQSTTSKSLTSTTCSGTAGSGCVALNVGNLTSAAIQVSGTWVATLAFEGSVDGVTYYAVLSKAAATGTGVTTATANGLWGVPVSGLRYMRVRASAYTSGTALVSISAPGLGGPTLGN